jgi:hypothetical protein
MGVYYIRNPNSKLKQRLTLHLFDDFELSSGLFGKTSMMKMSVVFESKNKNKKKAVMPLCSRFVSDGGSRFLREGKCSFNVMTTYDIYLEPLELIIMEFI